MRNAYLQLCDYTSRFRILKGGKISLVVSALLAGTTLCFSAPTGGVVTSGTASIASSGSTTTISQSSTKASINWTSFSIAASETVNFVQPSVSSITLNRVVGNEASVIAGALNANGQVWILNSNGVLFNSTASINTAGLLASTMNLSDADFQAGNYSFSGESTASVINQGTITISDAGYAALFGKEVSNEGVIKATLGSVELVGASAITLNLNGNSLVNLTVDKGVLDALVENKGAIYADGGTIYLTTNAVNELLAGVVNNTGILQANSIDDITGEIILYAHGGTTNVSGTLSAKEGFIETSGETLHVNSDVSLQAKEWLLDPTNITITDGGSDSISGSSIDADTITTVLNNGTDVTLTATNDITVNENITWSSATKLTLSAGDEIYVNATIANTNTTYGGVYFTAANTTDKVIFGTNGLVMLYNVYQLQWINTALQGIYELGGNIDASETSTWNSGAGFVPIGDISNKFTGTLDGNGYVIDGLSINRSSTYYVGLIGYAGSGAVIEDIGLTDVDITGYDYVGGLVGYLYNGTISDAYATGSVRGTYDVGGLVGGNYHGTITDAYATGSVSGTADIGGLVGYNQGTITDSYASGSVSGTNAIGGLVGWNYGTTGTITNSYATGSVSGTNYVGGLVGWNTGSSTITNAYAIGSVSGTGDGVGGLVGSNYGTITASYWDTDTTGQSSGVGYNFGTSDVTAITSSTAFSASTYSGFDFTGTWYMIEGYTRPFLRSEYSTTITNDHQLQLMALDLTASYTLANAITYTGTMWSSAGFVPIGDDTNFFTGTLDGNGYVIDGLTIYLPSTSYVGLIGYAGSGAVIENIGLTDVDITGYWYVGSLVGYLYNGTISDAYATGSVSGMYDVGGLVGWNDSGTITNSYATGSVSGNNTVGGLVGGNDGTITDSYATGSVNGTNYVGGLVGFNYRTITDSYATGSVNGTNRVGGLVGVNGYGTITNAYAIGSVSGSSYVGGLVGVNGYGIITNTYATGSVSGTDAVGGLVGYNESGTITASFWNTQTSGQSSGIGGGTASSGVSGKTTAQMQTLSTYTDAGWDIAGTDGVYPTLTFGTGGNASYTWSMGIAVYYSLSDLIYTYAGTAYSLSDLWSALSLFGSSYSSWVYGVDYVFLDSSGTVVTSYTNAGTYSNLYIDILKSGYTEATSGNTVGSLTIAKANATVTVDTLSSTYTGLSQSGTYAVSGLVNNEDASVLDTVTLSGSGTNVGTYTISGTASDNNYNLSIVDGTLTITKANATVTANSGTSTYNGTSQSITGYTVSGLVNNEDASVLDTVTLSGSGTNVGTYTISGTASDNNYNLSIVDGTLTITKANATVTANSGTSTYNGTSQSITGYTVSGLVNNEDASVLDTVTGASASGTNAGTYSTTLSGSDNNYNLSFVDGTLTITKANATVTVDSLSSTYTGLSQSITGYTVSGLVNNEDASVIDTVTLSGGGTNAGTYSTTLSGSDTNYNLSFTNGTLTITKANATVTANSGTSTYNGTSQSITSYTVSGLVNNEDASVLDTVTLSGGGTNVGTYTISGSGSDTNYNLSFTNGALTITPASLTVTAASASKTYDGTAYSGGAGVTYSGFVASEDASVLSGTLTYSGDSQGAIDVGAYTISVSGLSSGNYTLSFVDGVLSINAVASTTPSVAHIENGTATRSPFFASNTTSDTLTKTTQTEALQEIITQASSDTTKVPLWPHSLIQLVGGGIHLPDGLEDEYVTAQ